MSEVVNVENTNILGIILDKMITYLLRAIAFAFKFTFYLCVMFVKMILNLIEKIIEYIDENIFDEWDFIARKRKYDAERLMQIEMLEDNKTYRHAYKMQRNTEYNELYEELEQVLGSAIEYDREISIDKKIAKDMFLKIDKLTYQAERNAIEKGYEFALNSEGMYKDKDIYLNYIREDIIKRGK